MEANIGFGGPQTRRRCAQNSCLVTADGVLLAEPLPGKSGAIFNLVSADGLVCIPASSEGLDDGAEVDVIRFV